MAEPESGSGCSTSTASPPTCRLLDLPPELRNNIYAMVFTPASTKVNLLTARPPEKALLLTCRRVHDETRSMFRRFYRDFWTESKFCLHVECRHEVWDKPPTSDVRETLCAALSHIKPRDLAQIKILRVVHELKEGHSWAFDDGVWSWWQYWSGAHAGNFLSAQQIWYDKSKRKDMVGAGSNMGFRTYELPHHWSDWCGADVTGRSAEIISQAKMTACKSGLTVEELVIACCDLLQPWGSS